MDILLVVLVGLVIGFIVYVIASVIPFTRQYSSAFGLITAILYIVVNLRGIL